MESKTEGMQSTSMDGKVNTRLTCMQQRSAEESQFGGEQPPRQKTSRRLVRGSDLHALENETKKASTPKVPVYKNELSSGSLKRKAEDDEGEAMPPRKKAGQRQVGGTDLLAQDSETRPKSAAAKVPVYKDAPKSSALQPTSEVRKDVTSSPPRKPSALLPKREESDAPHDREDSASQSKVSGKKGGPLSPSRKRKAAGVGDDARTTKKAVRLILHHEYYFVVD